MRKALKGTLFLVVLLTLAGCNTMQSRPEPVTTVPGVDREPTKAEIYTNLGVAYMEGGRPDLALSKLQRALQEDPRLPSAHHAMGLLRARLREYDAAESAFKRALELQPKYSEAHNNYGVFLCELKRYDEADRQFKLALGNPLYRTPALAYENAGQCALLAGRTEQAELYFRNALGNNSRLPKSLYQLGRLEFERGNHELAQDYLDRFLKVSEQTPQSLWLGIRLARALGEDDRAASYALLLRARFPDSEENRLLMQTGNQ
jgi:type IV pilus assembly protein PilF